MIKFIKVLYKFIKLDILIKLVKIFYFRFRRGEVFLEYDLINFTDFNNEFFFGYYDLNPISTDNKNILSLSFNSSNNNKKIKIGFFNIDSPTEFNEVGTTETWCWQQGCRLTWVDKSNSTILYNKIVEKSYGSVIQNIHTKKIIKKINWPIYDINSNTTYGLSLNFSRLQRLRPGYGYDNYDDKSLFVNAPTDDGIFIVNISKNKSKLIITLDHLSKLQNHSSMTGANHYINHLSWNPKGNRFLFFHLWTKSNKRYSRLITSNPDGKDLFILENFENVSHYSWINNSQIIVTTHSAKNGFRYRIYNDKSKKIQNLCKSLNKDGHPSINPLNNNIFVSDTYPNKFSDRELFLYNLKNKTKLNILSVYSPYKYRLDYRCDLHPRWSEDGKLISFDSTHSGKRTTHIIRAPLNKI